jgi:hypothetical protein
VLLLLWGSVGAVAWLMIAWQDLDATYETAMTSLAAPSRPRVLRMRATAAVASWEEGIPLGETATGEQRAPGSAGRGTAESRAPDAPSSRTRHAGQRPDAGTPQGWKLRAALLDASREDPDPKRRAAAARTLAAMFGAAAGDLTGVDVQSPINAPVSGSSGREESELRRRVMGGVR